MEKFLGKIKAEEFHGLMTDFLLGKGFFILYHPLNSLDLTLKDFFAFPYLKKCVAKCCIETIQGLSKAVSDKFRKIPAQEYEKIIKVDWLHLLHRAIDCNRYTSNVYACRIMDIL